MARFDAKALEYPTDHLDLTGPGWPVHLLLAPLSLGLAGLVLAFALDRLLSRWVLARHRRTPAATDHEQRTAAPGESSMDLVGSR